MKTERRHELERNQLANWLSSKADLAKRYSTSIAAVALGLVVVFAVMRYLSNRAAGRNEIAWEEYYSALDMAPLNTLDPERFQDAIKALEDVADAHADARVGQMARLNLADLQRTRGADELFEDRNQSKKLLADAVENYGKVLASPEGKPLAEQARFGLAQTLECMGDLAKAKSEYEQVVESWPDGAFAMQAKNRLGQIDQTESKKFYDDFRSRKVARRPGAGSPGNFGGTTDEDFLDGLGGASEDSKSPSADEPGFRPKGASKSKSKSSDESSKDEPASDTAESSGGVDTPKTDAEAPSNDGAATSDGAPAEDKTPASDKAAIDTEPK